MDTTVPASIPSHTMFEYLQSFFTSEHILLYIVSLIIAAAISFSNALLFSRIMVRNGIPVHRGFIPNSFIISFGAYVFAFVLLFIENTPFGAEALGIPPQTVRWQLSFCLVGQTIGTAITLGCWFILLKLYKRYERWQGDKMYKKLFGWSREEVVASWEASEVEKTSPRAVEEGVGKQA